MEKLDQRIAAAAKKIIECSTVNSVDNSVDKDDPGANSSAHNGKEQQEDDQGHKNSLSKTVSPTQLVKLVQKQTQPQVNLLKFSHDQKWRSYRESRQ